MKKNCFFKLIWIWSLRILRWLLFSLIRCQEFFYYFLTFFNSFSVFFLLYSDNHRIFSVYLVKYLFSVINLDGILLYFTNFYVFNSIIENGLFLSHSSIFKARLINLNTFCISHVYRWFGISNNNWIFLHKPVIKINILTHTTRFLLPIWNVLKGTRR